MKKSKASQTQFDYCPDHWQIIKITPKDTENPAYYRIMCSWSGGYTQGSSWKMSSGIIKVLEELDHYIVHNHSGSVYKLWKGGCGWSTYGFSIYSSLKDDSPRVDLEVINIGEIDV